MILVFFSTTACNDSNRIGDSLDKDGLVDYDLKENEKELLQSLGLDKKSKLIKFQGPQEAITLNVKIYSLDPSHTWQPIGGSGMSIGKEREPSDILRGNFSMVLKDNYEINCYINSDGQANFQTDEIFLEKEILASQVLFLNEFTAIELEKEIPVALMVYNSESYLPTLSLDYYFEPEKLKDFELVQVVTLSFSKNEF
jgi:hypothetical protein